MRLFDRMDLEQTAMALAFRAPIPFTYEAINEPLPNGHMRASFTISEQRQWAGYLMPMSDAALERFVKYMHGRF